MIGLAVCHADWVRLKCDKLIRIRFSLCHQWPVQKSLTLKIKWKKVRQHTDILLVNKKDTWIHCTKRSIESFAENVTIPLGLGYWDKSTNCANAANLGILISVSNTCNWVWRLREATWVWKHPIQAVVLNKCILISPYLHTKFTFVISRWPQR